MRILNEGKLIYEGIIALGRGNTANVICYFPTMRLFNSKKNRDGNWKWFARNLDFGGAVISC